MKALCHTRKCYLTPPCGSTPAGAAGRKRGLSFPSPTVPAPSRPHKTVTFLTLTLDCIKHQVIQPMAASCEVGSVFTGPITVHCSMLNLTAERASNHE